jgi:hypothetical protein
MIPIPLLDQNSGLPRVYALGQALVNRDRVVPVPAALDKLSFGRNAD